MTEFVLEDGETLHVSVREMQMLALACWLDRRDADCERTIAWFKEARMCGDTYAEHALGDIRCGTVAPVWLGGQLGLRVLPVAERVGRGALMENADRYVRFGWDRARWMFSFTVESDKNGRPLRCEEAPLD